MKAVIVTPFDNYSYNVRIKYLEEYLSNIGYDCTVITSDFDHRKKRHYDTKRKNLELLHVPEYKKNLSFARIYSHFCFAKAVYDRLQVLEPDLIYGSTPPNFLFKYLSKYKYKNRNTKLIFEVGDLWPEALPVSKKVKLIAAPFLYLWSMVRNKHIKSADEIVYECGLFRNKLQKYHEGVRSSIIYLCKKDFFSETNSFHKDNSDVTQFAYIGSLNNIIDVDLIIEVLIEVKKYKEILFKIIGDGEKKKELIDLCDLYNIPYIDYGAVYDDSEKYRILKDCQFGFNVMKKSVVVGATMKSLEYFHWGLILINNISADTSRIVLENDCGINFINAKEVAAWIRSLTKEKIEQYQKNSRAVYEHLFSEDVMRKKYMAIFKR